MEAVATQSLGAFERYGLSGLVIFALFALLVYVLMQIQRLINDHNSRVNIIVDAHQEERSTWIDALKDNTEALRKIAERAGCSATKQTH